MVAKLKDLNRREVPLQKSKIKESGVVWLNSVNEIRNGPTLFFGNEFFDAIPIKQFEKKMTWKNYGKWHVDHIRPLASFDFTGPDREEQLHAAWSYTNMQPLWAVANIRKGARYEEGSLL